MWVLWSGWPTSFLADCYACPPERKFGEVFFGLAWGFGIAQTGYRVFLPEVGGGEPRKPLQECLDAHGLQQVLGPLPSAMSRLKSKNSVDSMSGVIAPFLADNF